MKKKYSIIWLRFATIVFITLSIIFLLITLVWFLLFEFNVIEADPHIKRAPLFLFLAGSILLGSAIAIYVGKVIIKPIQEIGDAFHTLSEGNFTVKVSESSSIPEIRDITKKFNAMVYDLSHTETLRTDFVANVSHEIKTPISSIEGYATLLQNHNLSEEKHDYYVEKILENSQRLANLTSNMLLLTKLENQEMVIDNKDFRLDEQIRKTILFLEDKWEKKNIQFDMDLPLQMYYGSEQLLEQVWYNIIYNAIKYSNQNGIIKITIQTNSNQICIEISDYGIGMSDEILNHIFEKFYQGDSSRKAEGNGLGLALVKRILDLCKGKISVKSELGKGTSFEVILPI